MKPAINSPVPDADRASLSLVEWVRRRFVAAWDEALEGQAPPDLAALLDPVPEPQRSHLRQELESLEQGYRLRGRNAGDTVLPPGKVFAWPPDEPNGTVDLPPGAATPDAPSEAADQIIDAAAPATATVDIEPADPLATVPPEAGMPTNGTASADALATVPPESGKPTGAVLVVKTGKPSARQAPIPDTVAGYEILLLNGRRASHTGPPCPFSLLPVADASHRRLLPRTPCHPQETWEQSLTTTPWQGPPFSLYNPQTGRFRMTPKGNRDGKRPKAGDWGESIWATDSPSPSSPTW